MNHLTIFVFLILTLILIQVLLYKLFSNVRNSKRIILLSYLCLYLVVLPLLLLQTPDPPPEDGPRCGLPFMAVMFGRMIIAFWGLTFTLVTHLSYWAIIKRKKFIEQENEQE